MGLLFYFASSILCLSSITADRAQWLVQYNINDERFELNQHALSRLSRLSKPVKVISAIGEARVGKSTCLNFLHYIWQGDMKQHVSTEEVFETGDSFEPVTHGIWASVLEKDNESIVLLDVEGTNLGNDAVTSHLSVFTCLMSSGILVFSLETVKNDILDFLYEVTRLSEHIFKSVDDNINFGHLHVVIRGALRMRAGMTFEESVRNSIVQPSGEDKTTDSKRKAIAKYFHKHSITASEIPFVPDRDPLKNIKTKDNVYWNAIKSLAELVKTNFPPKKTLRGIMVDGNALVQTAKTLTVMMNKNSWMDFSDTYHMVEKYLCDKSLKNVVEQALKINTADELDTKKKTVLKDFRNGCALREEVDKVEEQIKRRLFSMREMEKKDKLAKAAEEERIREVQRRINAEAERERANIQRKEAERKAQEAERKAQEEEQKRKKAEKQEREVQNRGRRRRRRRRLAKVAATLGSVVLGGLFSDARLKGDVTTMYPSKYEALGIREVKWTWNKDAETFGLQGEGHGVIAQEVEKLYPWAVVTGSDGYKRVLYKLLDVVTQSVNCNDKLVPRTHIVIRNQPRNTTQA